MLIYITFCLQVFVKVNGFQSKQCVLNKYNYEDTHGWFVITHLKEANDGFFKAFRMTDVNWEVTSAFGKSFKVVK
jgi:hypothetical protein